MFSALRAWVAPWSNEPESVALTPHLDAYNALVADQASMLSWVTADVQQFVLRPLVCPPYVLATRADGDVHALHIDGTPSSTTPIWQARTHSLAVTRPQDPRDWVGVVGLGRWLMSSVAHRAGGGWCAFDARSGEVRDVKKFNSHRKCREQRHSYPWFGMQTDAGAKYGMGICRMDDDVYGVMMLVDPQHAVLFVKLYNDQGLHHNERDLVVDDQRNLCYIVAELPPPTVRPRPMRQLCVFEIYRGSLTPTHIEPRSLIRYDGAVLLENTIGFAESYVAGEHRYREFDLRAPNTDAVLTVELGGDVLSPFGFGNRLITGDRLENVYCRSPLYDTLHCVDRRATRCCPISPPGTKIDFRVPQKLTFHP